MDILFLSDNFPPESNAPANRTFEHAREWVAHGHKVTVITCAPNFPHGKVYQGYQNKWYQREIMDGVNVVRVKTYITANERFTRRVFDFLSFMITGLIASLFQRRPDVIIATSPQFFCGVAGVLASLFRRVPFVLEIRDLWPESIVAVGVMPNRPSIKLLRKIEAWMYRQADIIVIVSEAFRPAIAGKIDNPKKIKVVVNGVNTSLFNKNIMAPTHPEISEQLLNSFVIGYAGTHGRAHGLTTVLEAARELQSHTDIHFMLVGAGEKRQEIACWAEKNQLSNVTLVTHQSRQSMPGLIALCDIALVPLRDLPLFKTVIPSKIFEYMAMGVPIIISVPQGIATEIVEKANCGLVVQPENSQELAAAILKIYTDRVLQANLESNALKASLQFRREKQAVTMLGYIEDTVSKSND